MEMKLFKDLPGLKQPVVAALSRVLAVIAGCLLGLGITYLFHSLIKIDSFAVNSEGVKKEE